MPDHGSPGSGYGSQADSREYLRKNARRRGQLLKQFTKLESGLGNSDAFRDGWVQAFGKHICGACGQRFEWASQAERHVREEHDAIRSKTFYAVATITREQLAASGTTTSSICTPSSDASTVPVKAEEDRSSDRSGCST